MAKIVDYKFIMMLGLSLVVYFLYREIEQLNKRISILEHNDPSITADILPKPKPKSGLQSLLSKLIDIPLEQHLNNQEQKEQITQGNQTNQIEQTTQATHKLSTNATSASVDNKNIEKNEKEHIEENNNIEEEYSNEEIEHSNSNNIYSCDKMDSHTIDNDPLMVDSLINMVNNNNNDNHDNNDNNDNNDNDNNNHVKETVDNLLKKKLDELQNMATELNININNDNGKKKRKVDLANDIFSQLNSIQS